MKLALNNSEGSVLHFQLPKAPGGSLLEHLLLESIGARRGGGIFAWATRFGADTLIANEIFGDFISKGEFLLTVGTDTITDQAAARRLAELQSAHPFVKVNAFLNQEKPLFHPKLSWFEHDSHLSLIVGSGNLTIGGLLGNWEAFTVSRLTGSPARAALDSITDFLAACSGGLAPITDDRVLDRVAANAGNERSLLQPTIPDPDVMASTDAVLVAEIPKASDRWAQANFDLENYEKFFGAERGSPQRRIVLRSVHPDGSVGEVENRPSVEVESQNYRFELAAARGKQYPSTGRPIGVFLRQESGFFFYMLLLPGEPGYGNLDNLLANNWSGRPDRMRRIRCSSNELLANWPDSPLWQVSKSDL
ncbi:phospholipase D family protein [Mycolicibacterium mageritense]|uniref:phospholipase D family protein n=1 Tax=Mycolicibacterium mageritense TaxID=53462 RepID=UPI0011D71F4B|nr:phospholipase D family protein [Mycolicibacterium mageritense]TXI63762.1 MAG: hypothetical protein E6Q55_08400 [Mycolicibacterium mageritense]